MPAVFESVVDVWLVWAIALVLIGFCSRRVLSRFRLANLRRFHACEEGASYALPYVLTFPIFVLLMAVFVQASLILICKLGTVYSAYSAARTFIVWQSAATHFGSSSTMFDYAKFKSCRAASMAMVPFASSNPRHLEDMYPTFPAVLGSDGVGGNFVFSQFALGLLINVDQPLYYQMYARLLADANQHDTGTVHKVIADKKQGAHSTYIRNKFNFAVASTRVSCADADKMIAWNKDVAVKVRYRMPFHVPGTARILGGKSMKPWWFFGPTTYYRDIESTVTMPSEAAKTPDGKLGIPYQPSLVLEFLN
jgi:hypothetical protein